MHSRLLVLGLDGATWDVLTPLTAMGVMPNLRQLMQSSALLELNSTQPFITPVAWASFQTGSDPHEHGILDYRRYDHRARQLHLNDTRQLRRSTLLDAIATAGGECVSLNLPMTYPPPPNVPGIVVGGLDSPSAEETLAHVPRFAECLKERGISLTLKPIWKRVPRSYEELSACVAETVRDFQSRASAARVADEQTHWRLLFVQFQALDALQHRAWHLLGLDDTAAADAASVAKVQEAFHALDRSIGELAELALRRDAALVVVSDHGFGSFRGKVSLPKLLAERGLLSRSSLPHRVGHRLSRAGFRARKWLWRRGRPGSSTAALARPLEMLSPINWRKSRAVALHGDLAGLVYLNTPARFHRGPLSSPQLEDETLAETLAAFREARHPETDEPLFVDAYAVRERHPIDPLEHGWPDAIAIPADGLQTRTRLDATDALIVDDPQLTGTHRLQGILMLPPCSQRALPRQAEMRDVAPTLLTLLGIAPPASMSGRSLLPQPQQPVAEQRVSSSSVPAAPVLSIQQQAQVESRLRDLGYLD